ncbi:MAG: alpha-hydroxy-acid oxidizing protein [Gemmatimonadetes bacterium]|nr:alpha-hydroxy-acid oxidizing protein [Gemmatimonadota bacterium]
MSDRAREIRTDVAGRRPEDILPFAFEEWERRAQAVLAAGPFGYVAGGAGAGDTMRANREAFDRWRIWPRMLRDVGQRDLGVRLFGATTPVPFLLAPVAAQTVMHPDGERATARAAKAAGIPVVLSTMSSTPLEEIARILAPSPRWLQLYAGKNRDVACSMIRRAEAAGYGAIAVTVDLPLLGWREGELRNAYLPFLEGHGIANYVSDPVFRAQLARPPEEDLQAAITHVLDSFVNPRFTWADIDWIRSLTRLPLLLKGILHPDDARAALDHGADGIIVSNHGGRQVDGSVAALDALPLVCGAVKQRVPVLMDSGIRRGADIVKALALGATAVLVGRPYAYALAVAGEDGVRHMIRNLIAEFDLQLGLSGCRSVKEVDRALLGPA